MAKVAVETEGAITIVSIDRFAEARNAVDPETANLLREAFLAFDRDESQSVPFFATAKLTRAERRLAYTEASAQSQTPTS